MIHKSTWHGKTRTLRRTRLRAPLGFLLACALLAALPAAASATTPEMRGEWELVVQTPSGPAKGTALVSVEANSNGEFAGENVLFSGSVHGTFSGTLEGSEASVKVTTEASGPFLATEFTSAAMTVESSGGSLSMTGSGTFVYGTQPVPSTLVATRIRTYKQIEEQEAREKREREEKAARAAVRGEWALTIETGPQVAKGTALITKEADASNEFASDGTLFESVVPGTFSGTLKGNETSVTVTTQAAGPYPGSTFTSTEIAVTMTGATMSMTGSGTITVEKNSLPAKFTATRVKDYQELVQANKEREAKEKQEKEALEAKERTERETAEKSAREAKERTAREAAEKSAREARERTERELAEKAKTPTSTGKTAALVSVRLSGKTFSISASGELSLRIANPNPYSISGRVMLLPAKAGKSSTIGSTSSKAGSLGTASFGVSPAGEQVVRVKLSRKGREELARHRTLRVLAAVTTHASGQTTTTKTFSLTLRQATLAHGGH